jgi:biotin carboxyl carrier protein
VASTQVVKLTTSPSGSANLSFEVGGILRVSNVALGQNIPLPFDFTSLYSQLGVATDETSPANLMNSSDLDGVIAGPPLMSLRAEGTKGMLDKACALRANIYIAKYLNQAAIIKQMRANLSSSQAYLQDLAQQSSVQANALAAAYATDELGGVVKTTSSSLTAEGTGITTDTGRTTANTTVTTTTSTSGGPTGTSWPTQNMTYQDYGFRYPSVEAAAQNDRAQLSLMTEQFAVFMAQGSAANLEEVFSNELTAYDMDVKRLQVAYLNSILLPPISGTVTGIYKQVGEAVLPGETVMRIEDTSTIYLVGTLISPQMIALGAAATITTNLFSSGTTGTLNGSVIAARGDDRGDDWWNVVISCPNSVGLAPNCTLDYEDTTVTIA